MKYLKSFYSPTDKSLYNDEPIFKETIDLIDSKLKNDFLGYSIWEKIKESNIEDTSIFKEQVLGNSLLFMTQVALFKLYKSKGIEPDYILAISAGELAATYCSGAITLDMALYILYYRAIAINSNLKENIVVKIYAGLEYFNKLKNQFPNLELGAHTSEIDTTIGGLTKELYPKFIEQCKQDNIKQVFLFGESCFHHSSMENIKNEIINLKIQSSVPTIKQFSFHNCKLFTSNFKYDSLYLYNQMRNIVDINGTIKSLFNDIKETRYNLLIQSPPEIIFCEICPISYILKNIDYLVKSQIIPLHNGYFDESNIEYFNPFKKDQNMYYSLQETLLKILNTINK